jgi:hypothetical protein
MGATSSSQPTPQQLNAYARAAVRAQAIKMTQAIYSASFAASGTANLASSQPFVNVPPRNVGLIQGFWVNCQFTITNGSGVQIDLTNFGPANIFQQIQFIDLQNNTRIQTTGWHIAMINAIKARRPFGTSLVRTTGFDDPINFGSNWLGQISAPATIAAAGTGNCSMWFWVPLSYSDNDYRGAVYANVVNATMQLTFVFNQNPVVAFGADANSAIYVGDVAGSVALARVSAATVTIYQSYLDQLPTANAPGNPVILPILDLATIYELKNTTLSSINAGQDFPIQYANFRDFLSTTVLYANTGAGGVVGVGADINYWALQSANFTNVWKKAPSLIALETRNHLQTDMPPGTYYFGSREKPISTTQYGNMQLILNAITANTGAYTLVGFEDFALVQTLSNAGSLAAS